MRFSLYLDDFETEKIFSYLRWIFLGVAVILFYFPGLSEILNLNHHTFNVLLTIGFFYMTSSQIALQKMDSHHRFFHLITKAGILFDYVAIIWLLVLSGGVSSPLFPIFYLLIMHSTIYWNTKGAFFSSICSTIGYTAILLIGPEFSTQQLLIFTLNIAFIWIVGLFGSLIVLRERKHLKQKEMIYELMVTDYLTGLYNHRSFQEELKRKLILDKPFMLVMADIDYFKKINDTYGHIAGDEVLAKIGNVFKEAARNFEGDAFRYGGEEFTILLPQLSELEVESLFNQIYEDLNELTFKDCRDTVTMSFGIASSVNQQARDELLNAADLLLYEAKRTGKNQAFADNGCRYYNKRKEKSFVTNY